MKEVKQVKEYSMYNNNIDKENNKINEIFKY